MNLHCLILVCMLRRVFIISILVTCAGKLFAQDTLVFKAQPQWQGGVSIADKCWFYEETSVHPLSFDEVKKQLFVLYDSSHRQQRFSNRPLIIQWLRFSISNVSATDTIHFSSVPAHTFIYGFTILPAFWQNRAFTKQLSGVLKKATCHLSFIHRQQKHSG